MNSHHPTITASPSQTMDRFLAALAAQDFQKLERTLAPNVWFRVLLPRALHESKTSQDAAAAYASWYGGTHGIEVLSLQHRTMAGREFLSYRFRLRPSWAPDTWHVIEQTGFGRVREGRLSRLDLVCSGFHEEPARGELAA